MSVLILLVILCARTVVGGKGSLGFIIDDTSSMSGDIKHVVEGAEALTDIILSRTTSQIENLILVTFNDPRVELRNVTKDKYVFKEELKSILENVNGGGDCPEMSLTGIEMALQKCNPGSYMYVFTDDIAKEYNKETMIENIKFLAQKKQSQVVFILTPNEYCGSLDKEFDEYYKIAAATSGQVFRLNSKDEVAAIVADVKETVSGKRTLLTSGLFPANVSKEILFTVDDKTEYAVVSCSGKDVQLSVERRDESMLQLYEYDIYNTYENITWINNMKSMKVKSPGDFAVRVEGGGTTSVVVFGRTDFLFEYGFSPFRPHYLNDTTKQPLADTDYYLSIKIENKDEDLIVESVEILNMDETLNIRKAMILVYENFYVTELFTPPDIMFKLAIDTIAINTKNHIKRIYPIPIEPLRDNNAILITKENISPRITIENAPQIIVDYESNLELRCKVYAFPKPNVIWVDNVTGESFTPAVVNVDYPYDYISILNIPKAKINATYSCKAVNANGEDSKNIEIEITNSVYFKVLERPINIIKEYGEDATLTCKIDAKPPATITWYRNRKIVQNDGNFELSDDNSTLFINYMENNATGSYICEARNEFNRKIFLFEVELDAELPELDGYETENITIANGSDKIISCSILKGKPEPTIRWFFTKQGTDTEEEMLIENSEIYLADVVPNMSGTYKCEASNEMGQDFRLIRLTVGKPPSIKDGNETVKTEDGKEMTLTCDAEGIPPPTIRWMVNGSDVTDNERYQIRKHSMSFIPRVIEDEGTYTCEVTNELGIAKRNIELRIFIPVNIEAPASTNVNATAGLPLLLPCYADGYPRPEISWVFYKTSAPPQFLNSTEDFYFKIPHVNIESQGLYKCTATNMGGSFSLTYNVSVEAPPYIKNKSSGKPIFAEEGDSLLSLPCHAVGSPKPDITWLHDDLPVALDGEDLYLDEKGTLIMRNVEEASSGFYTCQAKNYLGIAVERYEIQVKDK